MDLPGAVIDSSTFGPGEGGSLVIKVADVLTASSSLISGGSYGEEEGAGKAGTILVSAPKVILRNNGEIVTSGRGGGKAGNIGLEVGRLQLDSNAKISSESASGEEYAGAAGKIVIAGKIRIGRDDDGNITDIVEPLEPADSVRLRNNSSVATDGKSSSGGRIIIDAGASLYLSDSKITTNVMKGTALDRGGDIGIGSLSAGKGTGFVILNDSAVTANADEYGDGGAIFIHTDNYLKSSDSKVTATSSRGNDGTIKIDAPDVDISKGLTLMPASPLDASRWLKKSCAERTGEDVSYFVITGRDSVPLSFEAWIPGPGGGFGRPVSENRDNKKEDVK